jgi:hypothetical protein
MKIEKLEFLKVYNTPFKFVKPRLYIGKVAVGTPYFLPRKWVKFTKMDAENAAKKAFEDRSKIKKTLEEWNEYFLNHQKPVPKKIGFDFVGLGWKTKFGQYRFEYSPIWSFVFFKWQIAIKFQAPEEFQFWECYLYYINEANKDLGKAIEEFPCIWIKHTNGEKVEINYWKLILKNRYARKII